MEAEAGEEAEGAGAQIPRARLQARHGEACEQGKAFFLPAARQCMHKSSKHEAYSCGGLKGPEKDVSGRAGC